MAPLDRFNMSGFPLYFESESYPQTVSYSHMKLCYVSKITAVCLPVQAVPDSEKSTAQQLKDKVGRN